jgi:hypothetical protein
VTIATTYKSTVNGSDLILVGSDGLTGQQRLLNALAKKYPKDKSRNLAFKWIFLVSAEPTTSDLYSGEAAYGSKTIKVITMRSESFVNRATAYQFLIHESGHAFGLRHSTNMTLGPLGGSVAGNIASGCGDSWSVMGCAPYLPSSPMRAYAGWLPKASVKTIKKDTSKVVLTPYARPAGTRVLRVWRGKAPDGTNEYIWLENRASGSGVKGGIIGYLEFGAGYWSGGQPYTYIMQLGMSNNIEYGATWTDPFPGTNGLSIIVDTASYDGTTTVSIKYAKP